MPAFPVIDTHLHVWDQTQLRYSAFEGHPLFGRPYHVEDYRRDCGDVAVEAMVFLECYADFWPNGGQYIDETKFVEQEAARDPRIKAIVPMAPLEWSKAARPILQEMADHHDMVRGIRRIVEFDSNPRALTLSSDIDAPSPSRFNNDPRLLFEASGSAGKLCVFAVRLDTFPKSGASRVFYVGSNDFMELTNLRRHILGSFTNLPVAGEYLHRDAYRLAEVYGKDLYLYLKLFGASQMAKALRLKGKFDTLTERMGMGRYLSDALLQFAARLLPPHLPNRMTTFRDRFEHHLLLRMDGDGGEEVRKYLQASMPSATGDFFECDQAEGEAAFRHRYAVGGASVRYRALHRDTVENIVALDLAMPRDTLDWRETLPDGIEDDIVLRIPCGHFFCNVFHYDYAVRKGADWLAIEHRIIAHLAGRGIEFPAEHNVGHLYEAKPILRDFFRTLDPTNSMNPGIGGTPRGQGWS